MGRPLRCQHLVSGHPLFAGSTSRKTTGRAQRCGKGDPRYRARRQLQIGCPTASASLPGWTFLVRPTVASDLDDSEARVDALSGVDDARSVALGVVALVAEQRDATCAGQGDDFVVDALCSVGELRQVSTSG